MNRPLEYKYLHEMKVRKKPNKYDNLVREFMAREENFCVIDTVGISGENVRRMLVLALKKAHITNVGINVRTNKVIMTKGGKRNVRHEGD